MFRSAAALTLATCAYPLRYRSEGFAVVRLRFQPGHHFSQETSEPAQRLALGVGLDRLRIRVVLPDGKELAGSELARLSDAELRRAGLDAADVWELLDDCAREENSGQIVQLGAPELAGRYAIADGVDGNYAHAVVPSEGGDIRRFEAGALPRRDVTTPGWFARILLAIADAFRELFTGGGAQTWTFNRHVDSADYEARGVALARRSPLTLSAALALAGGREALRRTFDEQRPSEVDPRTWRCVVDGVLAGIDRELAAVVADNAFSSGVQSIVARDLLHRARVGVSGDALTTLASLVTTTRLSDAQAEELLAPLVRDPTAASTLIDVAIALGSLTPAVRQIGFHAVPALSAETLAAFNLALKDSRFRDAALTDADRIAYLRLWTQPHTETAREPALRILGSEMFRRFDSPLRGAVMRTLSLRPSLGSAMSELLSAPAFAALSVAERERVIEALEAGSAPADLHQLLAAAAESSAGERAAALDAFLAGMALPMIERFIAHRYTSAAAPLERVRRGETTLAAGAQGEHVIFVQRYLLAAGYGPTLGAVTRDRFDSAMTAAVGQFQRDRGLSPASGVLDARTFTMLVLAAMQKHSFVESGPGDAIFLSPLSLNRPTPSTDGPWRAARRWDDAEIAAYRDFASAYMRTRIDTRELLDCADLAYESLIVYARQRGLPIRLSNGARVVTHASAGPIAATVRRDFAAMNIPRNTIAVPVADGQISDIGIMDWDQSIDGHDSTYNHTYNILGWNPPSNERAFLIYGSLRDVVEPRALASFNQRHGSTLGVEDVSESYIIDAITADQGRGVSEGEQVRRVSELLVGGGIATPSSSQIREFILLVKNHALRDQPTPIYQDQGPWAYTRIMSRDLWVDRTALETARVGLSASLGLVLSTADLMAIVRAGNLSDARAVARARLRAAGVHETNLDAAIEQTVIAVEATRQLRRWNFAGF